MSDIILEAVRRDVSKLLREDNRGAFICSLCLNRLIREKPGITFTKGQIERALETVFKSPGAFMRRYSFVCDRCGNTLTCLGASRR